MNIMTVVRYKLKSGFEDEFIKAINAYNYSNSIFMLRKVGYLSPEGLKKQAFWGEFSKCLMTPRSRK